MTRKPADKMRPDEGRDAMWRLIREAKEDFTPRQIREELHIHFDTVCDYLTGLTKAGYLEATPGASRFLPTKYRLVKDVGVDAPRVRKDGSPVTQGQGRKQMWDTMRVLPDFTARELSFNASTELCAADEVDALHYIRYLTRAGYLVQIDAGNTHRQARYRMVTGRWSGPKPPQVQRVRQVFDPNTKTVVWSGNDGGAE